MPSALDYALADDGYYIDTDSSDHFRGVVEDFKKFDNILFNYNPAVFETHRMYNWRMEFRQRRAGARMYLHFHNKRNFGFRIRLPKGEYTLKSIFETLSELVWEIDPTLSEVGFSAVLEKSSIRIEKEFVPVEHTVTQQFIPISFEESMKNEQKRIHGVIGDYRGTSRELPDNVIDFTEYLKEPVDILPTDQIYEDIARKLA